MNRMYLLFALPAAAAVGFCHDCEKKECLEKEDWYCQKLQDYLKSMTIGQEE